METTETSLREAYARYFFSMFDACLHEDPIGQQQARQTLEEGLMRALPTKVPEHAY